MKNYYHDKDVAFVYLCGGRCKKEDLEKIITACFQKAQTKAQEIVAEKTKEVL